MNTGRYRRSDHETEQETGLSCATEREAVAKMLLPYKDSTFLQHIVDEIKKSDADDLMVVTGCHHSLLEPVLSSQQIAFAENQHWEEGMGSSIRTGVEYVLKNIPAADKIIILVCDQPYISSSLINELISTATKSGKGIVAAAYSDSQGTPVLFDKKYFPLLRTLNGQAGAKKIVQQFARDAAMVDFPAGATDIDTPGDYAAIS